MAFEFLKKLVSKLVGASSSKSSGAQHGGKTAGGNSGSSRHGRRGRRGRHGNGPRPQKNASSQSSASFSRDSNKRQQLSQRHQQHQGKNGGFRDSSAPSSSRDNRDFKREDRGGSRGGHGGRVDRDRGVHARNINTDAGVMRPGGEIAAEEIAKRKAAHAAWSIDSFVVEPAEGKKRFHDFDLPSEVMHGIADLGFKYCTEIQSMSLGYALEGKNIAGKAQTGSGKTAAFLVAILTRYLRTPENRQKTGGMPRALVIAPTRELVIQICKDADAIGKYCALRSLAVYGGMDYERQKREVLDAPVDLLVATPGRLLDFCQQRVIDLSHVDTLVIDEADRMLDMGFIPDVRRIVGHLPPKDKRATMLYSATLTDDVMRLAAQWMEEPVRAEVQGEPIATDTVRQVVYVIRASDKFTVLYNHLALHPEARTLIFCNRKATTEDVASSLERRGIPCEMLSGDVNQNKRLRVLEDFRAGKIRIVVATDVAGRGIHVDDIEYVINFDFPYEAEDYVHRIGRTGRAGNTGIAISFADEDESFEIPSIEKYIGEPLKCTMIPDDDPLLKKLPPKPQRGQETAPMVDEKARAVIDAREAVTDAEKAAAANITGIVTPTAAPAAVAAPVKVAADAATDAAKAAVVAANAAAEAASAVSVTKANEAAGAAAAAAKEAAAAANVAASAATTAAAAEATAAAAEEPAPKPIVIPPNSIVAKTATGRTVILPKPPTVERKMPDFNKALEPKVVRDESNIYSLPVEQKARFEDWTPGK